MWRVPDGTRLLSAAEFLSHQKISSCFSRPATKVRQQQVQVGREDVDAVEDKTNIIGARKNVLSCLHLEHPIVVDQFNLCHMIINDQLDTLKLVLLQFLLKSPSYRYQH